MPRKLTVGLIILSAAVAIAACSNVSTTSGLSIGPNFPKGTLYVTNSTQNGVSIYTNGEASGKGPAYQIGGSSTGLGGPQYLAFDASNDLWVTNYDSSTQRASVIEIKALATGNVQPFGVINGVGDGVVRPRGIGIDTTDKIVVIANVNPTAGANFTSQLLVYSTGDAQLGVTVPGVTIAGPMTQMNVPSGVALHGLTGYVTNLQSASVEAFTIPTPTPTPAPTSTPAPTPTPSPTPTGMTPSPSPTPSPTPTPVNIAPTLVLSGALTGLTQPSDIALDANADLLVSDEGSISPPVAPSILIFSAAEVSGGGTLNVAPSCKLSGNLTKLFAPTGVAVDTSGNIYVADTTATGAGMVYVFDNISVTCGTANVAPTKTFTSPGVPIGLGLVP
ncbi:MAG TPA: hypothetical protein VIN40_03820 [Candidatus Tyrphobacter sp.]